jgi:hypothetical protein
MSSSPTIIRSYAPDLKQIIMEEIDITVAGEAANGRSSGAGPASVISMSSCWT